MAKAAPKKKSKPRPLPDDGHVYFFTRVMKTGSSSFSKYMSQTLGRQYVYPLPHAPRPMTVFNLETLRAAKIEHGDTLRGYAGHFPAFAADIVGATRTITYLRDPVERTISFLKQHRRTQERHAGLTLEQVYEDQFSYQAFIQNHQTKIFSLTEEDAPGSYIYVLDPDEARLEAAKERLRRIDIVGLQEEWLAAVGAVQERWGWPPPANDWWMLKTSAEEPVSDAFRERILADNHWDVALYAWAKENVAVRGEPNPTPPPDALRDQQTERYLASVRRHLTGPSGEDERAARSRPAPATLYLDLLEHALLGLLVPRPTAVRPTGGAATLEVVPADLEERLEGRDWPDVGETMVGAKRLRNVRECVEAVLADGIPGDLIETGVWRGGVAIFMRALLAAHGNVDRKVFVADSFAGLPAPDSAYPQDSGSRLHEQPHLAVPEGDVRAAFQRYGLLDDQVVFVPGWFRETMPALAGETFAVLRLDGDLYESTIEVLEALYPRLSPGGFVIVDDYFGLSMCRAAVDDYRRAHGIDEPIRQVDWTGMCWRKSATPSGAGTHPR